MRTIEDVMADMQTLMNSAEGRSFTDDEVTAYEAFETELKDAQRTNDLRNRHNAYNMPVNAAVHVAPAKADNGLEDAFVAYLRTGQANADIAGLRVTNAQGEGSGTAGGYTVPPGFRAKLVEVMKTYGGLAGEVETINTSTGASLEWPTIDDTANTGDVSDEGTAPTAGADLVFGTASLGAYRYTSAGPSGTPVKVSVDLLQDSAVDIQRLLSRLLGVRIARAQAAHWCIGTGVKQPLGIVGVSITANKTLTTLNTLTYADALALEGMLDDAYAANAKWAMAKATWQGFRGLVDSAGRPLLMESQSASIGGRPERYLLDYPVVIDQAMPAYNTTGNKFAVLGDLREAYVIRNVQDLVVVVNPYSSASAGQVEYSAWLRADGTVQNRSAYVVIKNA